jgi:subtilase family serine protease
MRHRTLRGWSPRDSSWRTKAATLAVTALSATVLVTGSSWAGSNSASTTSATQSSTYAVGPVCGAPTPGQASCMALAHVTSDGTPVTTVTPDGYSPADLRAAYNLTSAATHDGGDQTVAIVDAYDDPNAEADLAVYRSKYGLPACTTTNGCFRKVNQHGDASPLPAENDSWGVEESLDLDMVSAICPNCHITLVEADTADSDPMFAAEDTAAGLAQVVSNSWGEAEYVGQTADEHHFHHPGVAIVASAGDAGSIVSFPASSRWVTSVGGTELWDGPNGWQERAWYDGGSGCSTQEPKPAWQTDKPCTHRTTADVSAVADPYTGVSVYDTSISSPGWYVVGGTSAAAPIIAGVYALAGNASTINAPAYPYAHAGHLHDVTQGSNGASCYPSYLCTAGRGYDASTGLGTPDGIGAF